MAKYIAKRVLLAIVTLFVLTSVVFVLVRIMVWTNRCRFNT